MVIPGQLDDTGSTGTTIHRQTKEKKRKKKKRVSRANSASLLPRRITNGFTIQTLAKCILGLHITPSENINRLPFKKLSQEMEML